MDITSLENKIICDDCINILKQLPDKCIDLVLTDPPYYNGLELTTYYGKSDKSNSGVKRTKYTPFKDKWYVPGNEWYEEILRVSKEQIIFGINYFEFAGSINLKRRYFCIEKDEKMYEASVKRLEDFKKQLTLF